MAMAMEELEVHDPIGPTPRLRKEMIDL